MPTITQTMNVDSVALWATGLLLGINLIFTGLTRITLALASRTALVH
jgi:uncharacterized membrane protein HdeD (DUF308 family)